jgi:hypothetical protein
MQYPRATLGVFALLLVFLSVMELKYLLVDFWRYEVVPGARSREFIILDRKEHKVYCVSADEYRKTYKSCKVELPVVPEGVTE